MNPKTLTSMILALLAVNGTITDEQAATMLTQAGEAFTGQVLDELSLQQMVDLLKNPEPPRTLEVPDHPKIIV
jgi:hypothetical protein